MCKTTNGRSNHLVTHDEPVEFEKWPDQVQDSTQIPDRVRGVYGIYVALMKAKTERYLTCDRLELKALGSRPKRVLRDFHRVIFQLFLGYWGWDQCWSGIEEVKARNQKWTSIMVLKILITGIEIVILVNYRYLVDISRWESPCVPKLLVGVHAILKCNDTRVILPRYERCIDLNGIENKNKKIFKYSNPSGIEKCECLIIDTRMV